MDARMVRGYLDLKLIELKTQNIILIHYIHMGKTLETSHFLKMVCCIASVNPKIPSFRPEPFEISDREAVPVPF